MQSNLHSIVIHLFILGLLQIPISFCQDNEPFRTCGKQSRCGNISINYPFWGGGNRPDYCGHPGFEISCNENTPSIAIESTSYKVISIDSPAQILTIARNDLLSNICLNNNAKTTSFVSTSFLYGPNNDQDIFLHLNCTLASGSEEPTVGRAISCNPNNTVFGIYSMMDVLLDLSQVRCQNKIVTRVNQINADALTSSTESLEVLKTAISGGFSVEWPTNIQSACLWCVTTGGRCGSRPSSGAFACHCTNGTHPIDCTFSQNQDAGSRKRLSNLKRLAVGGSAGIAGTILLSVLVVYYLRKRKRKPLICRKSQSEDHKIKEFMRTYGSHAPKLYNYSDIKKITNSFSDKIGQGGFGQVYKGKLPDGRFVAVKVLAETNGDGEDYVNEVASISRTSHVNIVGLLGFCYQRNRRALIYEYVSRGSLDKFLNNGSSDAGPLQWKILYMIAVGIARGLIRGCSTRIVHFDIKPHNILLDDDFCPKISDFGLSKLCERKESIVSMLGTRGTAGYSVV